MYDRRAITITPAVPAAATQRSVSVWRVARAPSQLQLMFEDGITGDFLLGQESLLGRLLQPLIARTILCLVALQILRQIPIRAAVVVQRAVGLRTRSVRKTHCAGVHIRAAVVEHVVQDPESPPRVPVMQIDLGQILLRLLQHIGGLAGGEYLCGGDAARARCRVPVELDEGLADAHVREGDTLEVPERDAEAARPTEGCDCSVQLAHGRENLGFDVVGHGESEGVVLGGIPGDLLTHEHERIPVVAEPAQRRGQLDGRRRVGFGA